MMDEQAQNRSQTELDLALTRAVAAGDPAARRELAGRLMDRTRTTVRCLAGDEADRDDIAQLCLLEVLRSAGNFQGRGRLERWADRIVVRMALRLIRRARPRRRCEVPAGEPIADAPAPLDLEDALGRRQVWQRLVALLQKLSPERRAAVALSLLYEHSLAEIAEITGAPLNTVRDRLQTGRSKLRKYILNDPELREIVPRGKR